MTSFRRLAAIAAVLVAAGASIAFAQNAPTHPPIGSGPVQPHAAQAIMHEAGRLGMNAETAVPTSPGQDAFGAIQEIVHILEADPKTDWPKVNLEALRQHLIDMNDVTLKADAAAKPIAGGIKIAVTGTGRTIAAIERMVPNQAAMIEETHPNGWSAKTEPLSNGVILTVTAKDPKQVEIIRGLGFIGVMASGNHHQMHHLAMAKGEFMPMH
jgi:pyruvate kinase